DERRSVIDFSASVGHASIPPEATTVFARKPLGGPEILHVTERVARIGNSVAVLDQPAIRHERSSPVPVQTPHIREDTAVPVAVPRGRVRLIELELDRPAKNELLRVIAGQLPERA